MTNLEFSINQRKFSIPAYSEKLEMNLLQFLRSEGYTGGKQVCGEGGCGACTVILSHWDDSKIKHESITACLLPLPFIHQSQITTIEGLSDLSDGKTHPVCDAFFKLGASQCGFCTPGFIMAFIARLSSKPKPKKEDLERIFDGNLCRCTGYRPILDAASIFCSDPVEANEYQTWQKDYQKCKTLNDTFPKEFQTEARSLELEGDKTSWFQPVSLKELIDLRKSNQKKQVKERAKLIGGNTDVGYKEHHHPKHFKKRISLGKVKELHEITWEESGVRIGAGLTISTLATELEAHSKKKNPDGAVLALFNQCRFFANSQIRNMATIGGGLMNFSSYSDLIPVWIAAGAKLCFVGTNGKKEINLIDYYKEDGTLDFKPENGDILESIFVPFSKPNETVSSYKYARRRMDSITFVSSGVYVKVEEKITKKAILCFDGLGVPGFRALKTEKLLQDKLWDKSVLKEALVSLKKEVLEAVCNPLPRRLQEYQARLAMAVLLRLYAIIRNKHFNDLAIKEEPLISRYPKVAHRSQIGFEENAVGILGKALPHRSAEQQTTGKAKYTADQEVPNCLYGSLVTSPVANGKIKSIDPSQALEHPDVLAFYSAKDIPGKNLFGFRVEDEEVLATSQVGYVGQPLGILVAKTDVAAREHVENVKIEIEEKTPLVTIDDAIDAKSFHGREKGYLLNQGDLDKGFNESDVVVSGRIDTSGQSHFYLEPQTTLVIPKDDGYFVYSSTQSPSNVVDHISRLLDISKNQVDVRVGRLGGGFGGKQLRAGPIAAICSLASHKLQKPVKLKLDRDQDMAFCPGRSPAMATYKAGFDKNGKIIALDIQFYISGGFTNDYSADIAETATLLMDSCYKVENVKVHGFAMKTHTGSTTATRGFGKPQATAVMESVLDHGAAKLGLDPTLLRERNLYQKGDKTITKTEIKDNVMSTCWNRLLEKSDYKTLRQEVDQFNKENRWLKRGLAAVCSKGNMGFIESDDINRGLALIHILRDGTVSVNHSGTEMGQGINTRMAQVAASCLDVPLEQVMVTDTQSSLIPNTPPTTMVATDLVGKAIIQACNKLKKTLSQFSGSFLEKINQCYTKGETLSATGIFTAPRLSYDYEKQEGDISYFFVWGAALAVVELDILSGSFRILKTNIVQDCGKSLNPHLDIGQAEGGFMFGVGYYMMEDLIYADNGRLITDNVAGYKIPSSGDVPLDWNIELLNYAPTGEGLHNSKGIGESNLQLGLSPYFAVKDAIRAARKDANMSMEFPMNFPASVDRVSANLPNIENLL